MSAWLGVFRRELRERWLLWPAALVAGGLAALLPLLPWSDSSEPDLVRGVMALVGSTLLGAGTLLLMGGSILCRDWKEGRLGFYLARPISAVALWTAKLAATVVLALGAVALVTLPSVLAGSEPWFLAPTLFDSTLWGDLGAAWPVTVPLAALVGALIGHGLGVIVRLRGVASLVDLALVAIGGLWAADLVGRFTAQTEPLVVHRLVAVLGGGAFLALLVAGWVQIRWAGTDARRAHHAWTAVVWSLFGLTLVGVESTAARLDRPTIDQIGDIAAWQPIDASRTVVLGQVAPWGQRAFVLVDAEADRTIHLDNWPRQQHLPVASSNGRWLAWPARDRLLPYRLHLLDLDAVEPNPAELATLSIDTSLALRAGARSYAAGDRWIALYDHDDPGVVLVPTTGAAERRRVPLPFPLTFGERLAFLADDRLRVWLSSIHQIDTEPPGEARTHVELVVLDIDCDTLEITEVGRLADHMVVEISPDHERLLLREPTHRRAVWTGDVSRRLYVLPRHGARRALPFEWRHSSGDVFLADGGFARIVQRRGSEGRPPLVLLVVRPDGTAESLVDLAESAYLGAEIAPGRLLVGTHDGPMRAATSADTWVEAELGAPITDWSTAVIDLATGETVRAVEGRVPLPGARPAGSPGSDWLIDGHGWPARLDPETGTLSAVDGFERGGR